MNVFRLYLGLLTLLFTTGCADKVKAEKRAPVPTYQQFTAAVRQQCKAQTSLENGKGYFFRLMNEDIPYYWKGTRWDFNGVTRTPGNGNIACGYFITIVLEDLGFKLKRTWLAQQAASVIIKQLTADPHSFSSVPAMVDFVQQQKEHDVFIAGLDFHTGFIIKDGRNVYFLHSNYISREGVIKEPAATSRALKASRYFLLGSLYRNNQLMKQWTGR